MIPSINGIIAEAIQQRVFPGAVVLVARKGVLQHAVPYGSTMYDHPGSWPVTLTTRYDIASLTKVFTATAALQLVDAGLLALDTPAAHYLPALQAHSVTIRHLLTHTSGLEVRLSSLRHLDAAGLRATVYALQPARPPGTHTAYVNVSSLLLGDVVAAAAGQPLDSVIAQSILEPLGMHATGFRPAPELLPQIAPSERDDAWRGGLVHGSVHDESAHVLGGVAGHAGLFSTAADLWRFAQMWLQGGLFAGVPLLQPQTVALATRHQAPWLHLAAPQEGIRCGLGWMLDRAEIMGRAPAGSYGHTGFTGPVLVIVPRLRLVVIVLCNRTYPRRSETRAHLPVVAAVVQAAMAHE
jgi:CubicO group peptidase (beta-lactamase class C family)